MSNRQNDGELQDLGMEIRMHSIRLLDDFKAEYIQEIGHDPNFSSEVWETLLRKNLEEDEGFLGLGGDIIFNEWLEKFNVKEITIKTDMLLFEITGSANDFVEFFNHYWDEGYAEPVSDSDRDSMLNADELESGGWRLIAEKANLKAMLDFYKNKVISNGFQMPVWISSKIRRENSSRFNRREGF